MESSSGDDGDPATPRIVLLLIALLISIHPQLRQRGASTFPQPKAPAVAVKKAAKHKPVAHHKARKKLYLTFDDGPNRGTRNVWTIVRDEGVPVSFFIVGEHVFDSHTQSALFDSLQATPDVACATTVIRMRVAVISSITTSLIL